MIIIKCYLYNNFANSVLPSFDIQQTHIEWIRLKAKLSYQLPILTKITTKSIGNGLFSHFFTSVRPRSNDRATLVKRSFDLGRKFAEHSFWKFVAILLCVVCIAFITLSTRSALGGFLLFIGLIWPYLCSRNEKYYKIGVQDAAPNQVRGCARRSKRSASR